MYVSYPSIPYRTEEMARDSPISDLGKPHRRQTRSSQRRSKPYTSKDGLWDNDNDNDPHKYKLSLQCSCCPYWKKRSYLLYNYHPVSSFFLPCFLLLSRFFLLLPLLLEKGVLRYVIEIKKALVSPMSDLGTPHRRQTRCSQKNEQVLHGHHGLLDDALTHK